MWLWYSPGMAGGTLTATGRTARSRISDETLETGKLLVELLHATYATRRQRLEAEADAEAAIGIEAASGGQASARRAGAASAGAPSGTAAGVRTPSQPASEGVTSRTPMSAHAVRAAIHVYQHGERTVGQISSGLGISYGWASRVVEELEAAGYVVRERDEHDRRIVHVRLDPTALAEVEREYARRGVAVERALEPFSETERATIRLFLRRVTDSLREADPGEH
jgi:DNA-binding MarR family transcriptional regulator